MRRNTIALATTLTTLLAVPAIAQPAWPTREVKMIVQIPAGAGPTDTIARLLAERLKVVWGQPVVIENLPGNGGSVGVAKLAKSAPDGYTLVTSGDAAIVVNTSLYKSLPYDPVKDLAPIIQIGRTPNILVVNAQKGQASLKDLIAAAKAKPGTVTFNSMGYGTSQHMAIEQLKRQAGVDVLHAPSRTPTAPDILGGHVDASFMNITVALPHVQAGAMRALASTGAKRSQMAADIPTVAEQGFPGFEAVAWSGIFAPAGTPAPIVAKINADIAKALAEPEIRGKITKMGIELIDSSTPQGFSSFIKAEIPRIAELIKASGIKID